MSNKPETHNDKKSNKIKRELNIIQTNSYQ